MVQGFKPASLFTKLVGCDPVNLSMTLYWNCFTSIGVDEMVTSLSEHIKAVLLKIFYKITPLIKHPERGPGLTGQAFDCH